MGLTMSRPVSGNEANQPLDLTDLGECSICLDPLEGKGKFKSRTVSLTPCEHYYHSECLTKNMAHNHLCPNCRSEINPENVVPLSISFHEAAEKGSMPAVKLFINKVSVDVDALNKQGETALMLAARKGNLDIVKTLINHGADLSICTKNNKTAFDMAQRPDVRCYLAKVLIKKSIGPDTPCDDTDARHITRHITHYLTELSRHELCDVLECTDIDANTLTACLDVALQKGKTDIAETLINCGANLHALGTLPLELAAETEDLETVQYLLSRGEDITTRMQNNKTLFDIFPANELFDSLPEKNPFSSVRDINAPVDQKGSTLLYHALESQRWTVTKKLMNAGANLLMPASINEKVTILDWAVSHLALHEIYNLIRNRVINVDLLTQDNLSTLYHRAATPAMEPHTFTFEILAKKGVDLSLKDKNGETALHIAAREGGGRLIKKVVSLGVDLDATNIKGETALHLVAVRDNFNWALDALIKAGADVNVKALDGSTPRDRAVLYGCKSNAASLLDFRAIRSQP
ncbi:ankyrin repeat domain-containing protein [Endozoicomonas gorgoniicola]|uniref:Ankyrin repeat domain-containing protein n=1 Tax=Endozoicomonas gorgoniicola TaxID=1234144 RepID=A0ABT3N2U5_9GAMM|nr:ankyrin repeat domain-containing protein [Endozoicomonas gorgoniicola]MCW7555941.1 ankyrin repeat domain-containing protein [Endozoicomonas gorgoniicola]